MGASTEGTIEAARRQIARCESLLRAAASARRDEEWHLIGNAIGAAATAGAWLDELLKEKE